MFSTTQLTRMRESLLQVTAGEWAWLWLGLIIGATAWVLLNRKWVRKIVDRLRGAHLGDNQIAIVEGAVGLGVMALNGAILYLCNLNWNFFLFGFSLTGLLVGAWILIPGSFE